MVGHRDPGVLIGGTGPFVQRRALVLATAAGLAGCSGAPPAANWTASTACSTACLHGTFYQPLLVHQERSDEQWRGWMADMAALGVQRLVLQHAALEPYDVLVPGPGDWRRSPGGAALARILDAALLHGVKVWIGLSYDPRFWAEVAAEEPERVGAYLGQRSLRLRTLADALKPATGHPSAAGWYVSDEIDDLSWVLPERAELLARWLAEVTRHLHQTAPRSRIAISGFVHAATTPAGVLAGQWRRWLNAAPLLDEVLLQDGIGAQKTTLSRWPAYLEAVTAVARELGRRCVPVVELFAPGSTESGAWVPAPVARVARQMQVAQAASAEVIAFSVPEFVTTEHRDARQLHAYFMQRCRAQAASC